MTNSGTQFRLQSILKLDAAACAACLFLAPAPLRS